MPGAYTWGWCVETGKWVKLRVDADGSIHVVGYVDELDDIGDVNVPTPADDDLLYWDEAAGKWQDIAHLGVADAHHAKYLDTEAVSAVEAAGLALASGKNVKVIQALTADHTWSGLTAVMTAGIALVRPQAVYVGGDSKMEKALATGAATMPAIALATGTIAEDAAGEFLLQGFFRDDTWDWTIGGLLYISEDTAGALTQELPAASGEQVQVVGVAITADIIYFNPSFELVEIS